MEGIRFMMFEAVARRPVATEFGKRLMALTLHSNVLRRFLPAIQSQFISRYAGSRGRLHDRWGRSTTIQLARQV